jgi:hypothetical protein
MACAPNESCGFVMKDGSYQLCRNTSPDPQNSFAMHHDDVIAYLDDALAYVHSECYESKGIQEADGVEAPGLSAADMEHQWAMGIPLGICKVLDGFATNPFFYGDDLPPVPLVGRPFVNGIWDCYSAIRDVYRWDGFGLISRHYGDSPIILPDYPRDFEWWGSRDDSGNETPPTADLYRDNFEAAGFRTIDISELREGDVFLAQVGSTVVNHGGVYMGNGEIFHHLRRRLSRREPAPQWIKFVTDYLRYDP